MGRRTIVIFYLLLAIAYSAGFELLIQFWKSPYHGVKCMDGPTVCKKSEYRSIDGSCNNLKHRGWGMPNNPYGRLLPYNYADGKHKIATMRSGKPLPSARIISKELFPPNEIPDPQYTLLTMQNGQFVTHDMSLTGDVLQIGVKVQPVVCCSVSKLGPDATNTDRCAPIVIPADDPDYGPANIRCFDFTRTATTRDRGCSGPDEVDRPISVVTSWLDLSTVYGSSDKQAKAIRSFEGGTLLSVFREGQEWPPQQDNVTQSCRGAKSAKEPCYKCGDVRANQNPQLTTIHIMWFREHNRVARKLSQYNPYWDDNKVFEEARRIVIAEYQHIIYTQYLPIILGKDYMMKEKILYPDAELCVNDYDRSVNPAVLDEHANGGPFRFFHSAIDGQLELLDEDRETTGIARLSDWLNRPLIQEANDTVNYDHLMRGMTTQNEQFNDRFVPVEIHKFLFKGKNKLGIDLRAFDIQRARDHGIPTYAEVRKYLGLPVPKSFKDLTRCCGISPENVRKIKKLYGDVEDVELTVGGSLEPLLQGTISGETFHTIILEMFKRTRMGDRFFYQNCKGNGFTPEQLQSIQETSMSRVICDNSKIDYIQSRPFEVISEDNFLMKCDDFSGVDLSFWS